MTHYIVIVVLLCSGLSLAQPEHTVWGEQQYSPLRPTLIEERNYSLSDVNLVTAPLKILAMGYWFFISDQDGENCPFNPSCSQFAVESFKEANPLFALMMTSDRLIRDTNIFDRAGHYRYYKKRLYDPVTNHVLDTEKIRLTPW